MHCQRNHPAIRRYVASTILKQVEETNQAVQHVLYPAIPFDQVNEVEEELRLYNKRWYDYYWTRASKPESEVKRKHRVIKELINPVMDILRERLNLSIQANIDVLLGKRKIKDVG